MEQAKKGEGEAVDIKNVFTVVDIGDILEWQIVTQLMGVFRWLRWSCLMAKEKKKGTYSDQKSKSRAK